MSIIDFLASKRNRRILGLVLLGLAALIEFLILGLARRTFVFYNDIGGIVVEDRMLKRSSSRETDITRYIEETLLGPSTPDSALLFPGETRLKSVLYANKVVYADFSADAAFSVKEGGKAFDGFKTLYDGILRNFSYVKDVRFFIEGNAAYVEKFQKSGENGFPGG